MTFASSERGAPHPQPSEASSTMLMRPRVPQKVRARSAASSHCNMVSDLSGRRMPKVLRTPSTFTACAAADRYIRDRHRVAQREERRASTRIFLHGNELPEEEVDSVAGLILKQLQKEESSSLQMRHLATAIKVQGPRSTFNLGKIVHSASRRAQRSMEEIERGATRREPEGLLLLMFPLVIVRLRRRLAAARQRIAARQEERARNALTRRVAARTLRDALWVWRHRMAQRRVERRATLRYFFNRITSFRALMMMQRRLAWAAMERLLVRPKAFRCLQVWHRVAIAARAAQRGEDPRLALARNSSVRGWVELDDAALGAVEVVTREEEASVAATFTSTLLRTVVRHWKLFVVMARKEKADERRMNLWAGRSRPLLVKADCLHRWQRAQRQALAASVYVANLQHRALSRWAGVTASRLRVKQRDIAAASVRSARLVRQSFAVWRERFRLQEMLAHVGTAAALQRRLTMLPAVLRLQGNRTGACYVDCFVAWRALVARRKAFKAFAVAQHVEFCRALTARAFAVWKVRGGIAWETGRHNVSDATTTALTADDAAAAATPGGLHTPFSESVALLNGSQVSGGGGGGGSSTTEYPPGSALLAGTAGGSTFSGTNTFLTATGGAAASMMSSGSPLLLHSPSRPRGRSVSRAGGSPQRSGHSPASSHELDIAISLPRHIATAYIGAPHTAAASAITVLASGHASPPDWSLRRPINWTAVRAVERQLRSARAERLPQRFATCLRLVPLGAMQPSVAIIGDDGVDQNYVATFAQREVRQRQEAATAAWHNSARRKSAAAWSSAGATSSSCASWAACNSASHHDRAPTTCDPTSNPNDDRVFFDGGFLVSRICQALLLYAHSKKYFIAAYGRGERAAQEFALGSSDCGAVAQALQKAFDDEDDAGVSTEQREALRASALAHLQSQRAERIRMHLADRAARAAAMRAKLRRRAMASAPIRLRGELPPELIRMDMPDVPRVVAYFNEGIARNAALLRVQLRHQALALTRLAMDRALPKCNLPVRPPQPPPPPRRRRRKSSSGRTSPPRPFAFAGAGGKTANRSPRRRGHGELLPNRHAVPARKVRVAVERIACSWLRRTLLRLAANAPPPHQHTPTAPAVSLAASAASVNGLCTFHQMLPPALAVEALREQRRRSSGEDGLGVSSVQQQQQQQQRRRQCGAFTIDRSQACIFARQDELHRVAASAMAPDRFDAVSTSAASKSTTARFDWAGAASVRSQQTHARSTILLHGAPGVRGGTAVLSASQMASSAASSSRKGGRPTSPRNSQPSATTSPSDRDLHHTAAHHQSISPHTTLWHPASVSPLVAGDGVSERARSPDPVSPQLQLPPGVDPFFMTISAPQ